MIPIKRVDHISFAAWSIDEQIKWFEGLWGLKLAHRFDNPEEGYTGAVLDLPNNQMQIEVLQPLGEHSFVEKFLRERGPGFHHVTVQVESMEETAAALRKAGIEPFHGIHQRDTWLQTYIHPRDGGGALWQVFEEKGVGYRV